MSEPEDQQNEDQQPEAGADAPQGPETEQPETGSEAPQGDDNQQDTTGQDQATADSPDDAGVLGGTDEPSQAGNATADTTTEVDTTSTSDNADEAGDEEDEQGEQTVFDRYSDPVARIARRMEHYLYNMAPRRPQTASSGKYQQRELYTIYLDVLGQPPERFNEAMSMLLSYFAEHQRGALSSRLINRFLPQVPQRSEDNRALEALNRLFTAIAEPSTRQQALKHVDLNKVVQRLPDEDMANKLLSYFDAE